MSPLPKERIMVPLQSHRGQGTMAGTEDGLRRKGEDFPPKAMETGLVRKIRSAHRSGKESVSNNREWSRESADHIGDASR